MEKKKEKIKKKKNNVKYRTSEQEEMIKFFWVIVIILACVGVIYFLTRAFVTKDLGKDKKADTEQVISGSVNYSVTIVGQILNRPYDEYYVLVFDNTGDYATDMNGLMTDYNSTEKHIHLYSVDLSNKLNKDYYDAKNENKKATTVSEFKFGDITLLKIKNGKVVKYITDYEKMKTELKK